jgi:methionyl-tRNA formyltransferase
MRIVFATTGGPLGLEPLRRLAREHTIAAVVRPAPRGPWWTRSARTALRAIGLYPRDPVSDWSREAGVPTILASSGSDDLVADALRHQEADLLCIAGFPWLFRTEILAIPPAGALNLHPSLLPRHRGANPFFWTYYHDDRDTGVTVHVATAQADAGPIVAQHMTALARGLPVERLYCDLAGQGAQLFDRAVRDLAAGLVHPAAQDESRATLAPRVRPGTPMVAFSTWDVERVWHFLAGLGARFREPLRDERGRPVAYRSVATYERRGPGGPPGTAVRRPGGWTLWCRDGSIDLA